MILHIFTVYDSKAECYLAPFTFKTVGEAVRSFSDTANDPNSMLFKHSSDFTLFQIGEFDDTTGMVEGLTRHIALGKAIDFNNKDAV